MARARTPAESWVAAAFSQLAEGGSDTVRVEALANRLEVTKGSFYWHFRDRRALVDRMLDSWEHGVVDTVIGAVDSTQGTTRERLRRLFGLAADYATPESMGVELAIREWARRDERVAVRLRRVDDRRMAYMRSLFGELSADPDDVEARCLIAFALFVGDHFITAGHGSRTRAEVMTTALERLML
jgi:AcrR family transcriptional regulator